MRDGDEEPFTIGELLLLLRARGVYDVAILDEQLGQFGFVYRHETDRLEYLGRSEVVGSQSADEIRRSMDEGAGGTVTNDLPAHARLVDAINLSETVFQLLFPGRTPPGRQFADRDDGYAANVAAIRSGLTTAPWSP